MQYPTIHATLRPMNGLHAFGDLIRVTRESKGWNQRELARRMGRDAAYVSRLENGLGKVMPEPSLVRELAQVLDVPVYRFLLALGYIDGDEREPGVAYVIREDDPRAALLASVDGLAAGDVAAVTGAAAIFARALRRETGADDGPSQHVGTG